MNKQTKIDKLYELLSDKTLSFGCRLEFTHEFNYNYIEFKKGDVVKCCGLTNKYGTFIVWHNPDYRFTPFQAEAEFKIIGHPVTLARVLLKMGKGINNYLETIDAILGMWQFDKDTLEQQSDECIDFIYNLFKNER